jgi:hypothetical protein
MKVRIVIYFYCLVLLTACGPSGMVKITQEKTNQPTPEINTLLGETRIPVFGHIILVVMENLDFTQAQKVPSLQKLMTDYAYTSDYTAINHPSLPNYIALISGDTYGFGHDCQPSPDCHVPATGKSLADTLEANGLTWKAYIEAMPQPCTTENTPDYVVRHNPFIYFDNIRDDLNRCTGHDVPFPQFKTDLDNGNLPNFSWISPDLCNSMHNKCELLESRVNEGTEWLSTWIPNILGSEQFQQDGLLVITFDEGASNDGCCGSDGGGRVLTLLISPNPQVRNSGWFSDTPYNHYSLLRTIEDNWNLPYLGHSGDAEILPMDDFFVVTK